MTWTNIRDAQGYAHISEGTYIHDLFVAKVKQSLRASAADALVQTMAEHYGEAKQDLQRLHDDKALEDWQFRKRAGHIAGDDSNWPSAEECYSKLKEQLDDLMDLIDEVESHLDMRNGQYAELLEERRREYLEQFEPKPTEPEVEEVKAKSLA